MLERLVNMTIRFFVGVWVVRYLGPDQYGVYSYALSFVGLFAAFSTLGLDNIVVRNLSREGVSEGEILGTAFVLRVSAALLTMCAVTVTVFSVADRWLVQLAVVIVAGKLIFKAADVFDFWFQSKIKSKYPVWVRSIVTLVYAGSQIIFILAGFSVLAFIGLVVLQMALQGVGIFLIYCFVREEVTSWSFRWSTARSMMRDAWPLIFSSFSVAIYMKIDQVMLGNMVDESAVGIYATAAKISELWYFIPMAIAGSVFPKIVSMKDSGRDEVYRERLQTYYDAIALVSYIIIIPVSLSAYPLVNILFGEAYAESAPILQIHIWSFIFVALGVSRSKWLIAENMTRIAMFTTLLGAITNVALNIFLIPTYGGNGAAWSTLISYAIYSYLSLSILKITRPAFKQLTRSIFNPFRIIMKMKYERNR